jgi:transglutaminase-like putative cysteine protease
MFPRLIISFSIIFLFFTNISAGDNVPNWMKQAASVTAPIYEKDVPAVVLHDEQQVSLNSDGKLLTTENYAVKLLTREGRNFAVARAYYLVSSGKVRDIEGWLIRADGSTKFYDKKTILDVIADQDDVYNEGRLKVIDATNDTDAGYIFGYTIVSEDTPLFYQDVWQFQGRLPTVVSRYTLNLPSNWKASSITFNAAEVKPQISGTTYIWEMRNLAPIPPEPMSPSVNNIAPRIAVNYSPENNSQTVNRAFADWTDVSRWATGLHDSQVIVDDAVAAKARDLTANAKTEFEKIHAIGSYVQNLQYISIDIGVGYGNGYRPRSSSLVLARGYGDCKDKANLMRAMLKSLKIEAYPIAIFSGDPTFVRAEWASPRQFNHCIIAVKVSDGTIAPTIITDAKLGRLLIFDATDSYTPVGDLPDYLQGSMALIIAGDNGGLSKMPVTPPESDLLERNIEATLSETGGIKGKISERANGQTSTSFRRELRELSASDYRKAIEGWLTRGATGAQLVNVTSKDRQSEAGFDLDVEFSVPTYGQLMQNRLLVFKPVIVGRRNGVILTDPKRNHPIALDSNAMKETIVFNLPQGFVVDEMPDAVSLETPFGKYSTKYEVKDGKLFFSRTLSTVRTNIPVDKYGSVKDFYSKIHAAEQSPVVLLRK